MVDHQEGAAFVASEVCRTDDEFVTRKARSGIVAVHEVGVPDAFYGERSALGSRSATGKS